MSGAPLGNPARRREAAIRHLSDLLIERYRQGGQMEGIALPPADYLAFFAGRCPGAERTLFGLPVEKREDIATATLMP